MFKNFLLSAFMIPTLTGFAGTVLTTKWDLSPQVLLITSYQNAEQESSQDHIIFQELNAIYGSNLVTAIFSPHDGNMYAVTLINLINKFNLKKVFVLNANFNDYLLASSADSDHHSNLVSVLQQFTNVDFYFFNSHLSKDIKITNNIYEIRLDQPNKKNPAPKASYGALIAEYFYDKLIDDEGNIDTNQYNFDTDAQDGNKWIVRIGVITDQNDYHQQIANDFISTLKKNVPLNTKYEYVQLPLRISNSYNLDNVNIVKSVAKTFYQKNRVNFIFSPNYWYNNAIARAASDVAAMKQYTKTIKFIGNSVVDKKVYDTYMLFGYNVNFFVLKWTAENNIPEEYEVLGSETESFHSYGLNENISFFDGLQE